MPFKGFALRGNYKQEVRSGKNKLPLNFATVPSGTTAVLEEDTFVFNREATGTDANANFNYGEPVTFPAGTYAMSVNVLGGTVTNQTVAGSAIYLRLMKADGSYAFNQALISCDENGVTATRGTGTVTWEEDTEVVGVRFYLRGTNNYEDLKINVQLEAGSTATDYEQYGASPSTDYPSEIEAVGEDGSINETVCNSLEETEGQTIAMPCQQPMLDEDYFDWENEKEVHGWYKHTFTGTESITISGSGTSNWFYQVNGLGGGKTLTNAQAPICTHYKAGNVLTNTTDTGIYTTSAGCRIREDTEDTVENFKARLAELYTAGTPVIAYFKTTEPTELDFTTEQKTVAEQIKALHSYKNITHIFSTDNVSANVETEYYKDNATVRQNDIAERDAKIDNLQQQIDEITTLLSTTETSAMLLDNYQTDLESEV